MQFSPSESIRYHDFTVELRSEARGVLAGRVAASPVGESSDFALRYPVSPQEINEALASITYAASPYLKRSAPSASYDPIIGLGERLFQALLRESPAGRLFRLAQDAAQSRSDGLRIRIAAHDLDVLALPWEFMFDGAQSMFMALSLRTPIVRRLAAPSLPALRPVSGPLRVLVAVAEVQDFDAAGEIEILRQHQARSGLLDITVLEDATLARLAATLNENAFHVVHFIATGAYGTGRGRWSKVMPEDGRNLGQGLLLMGADAAAKDKLESAEFVPAVHLHDLIATSPEVRFVMFSACETDQVAAELSRTTPLVLGMRGPVTNRTCQTITSALYQALVAGQPLEAAVTAGRQAIDRSQPGSREWGLPTLYVASPHGILFTPGAKGITDAGVGVDSVAVDRGVAAAAPAIAPREQLRLQAELEIEQRNLESLRTQQDLLGNAVPDFIKRQVAEAVDKVAELSSKLAAFE